MTYHILIKVSANHLTIFGYLKQRIFNVHSTFAQEMLSTIKSSKYSHIYDDILGTDSTIYLLENGKHSIYTIKKEIHFNPTVNQSNTKIILEQRYNEKIETISTYQKKFPGLSACTFNDNVLIKTVIGKFNGSQVDYQCDFTDRCGFERNYNLLYAPTSLELNDILVTQIFKNPKTDMMIIFQRKNFIYETLRFRLTTNYNEVEKISAFYSNEKVFSVIDYYNERSTAEMNFFDKKNHQPKRYDNKIFDQTLSKVVINKYDKSKLLGFEKDEGGKSKDNNTTRYRRLATNCHLFRAGTFPLSNKLMSGKPINQFSNFTNYDPNTNKFAKKEIKKEDDNFFDSNYVFSPNKKRVKKGRSNLFDSIDF